MDRGPKGLRWAVAGDLVGSSEIWLEAYRDGVILHYFVRADPAAGPGAASPSAREADRIRRAEALAWTQSVWNLKQELESGRAAGCPVPA